MEFFEPQSLKEAQTYLNSFRDFANDEKFGSLAPVSQYYTRVNSLTATLIL